MAKKAFASYENSRGLYYYLDKEIRLRSHVIDTYKRLIAYDAHEVSFPTLVPRRVLEQSHHLESFQDEIFSTSNFCLRPQTAQSIFANLKELRHELKGDPLKIYQIGKAYRNQKTTRDGKFRMCEFEQMELEMLYNKNKSFDLELYKTAIVNFFKELKLSVRFQEIPVSQRPHYSLTTIDLYVRSESLDREIEVGCINYRGNYDLYNFSDKQKANYVIYEISLGLDRIVNCISDLNE
jgi:glycyl-tRNA synthetase (class II)